MLFKRDWKSKGCCYRLWEEPENLTRVHLERYKNRPTFEECSPFVCSDRCEQIWKNREELHQLIEGMGNMHHDLDLNGAAKHYVPSFYAYALDGVSVPVEVRAINQPVSKEQCEEHYKPFFKIEENLAILARYQIEKANAKREHEEAIANKELESASANGSAKRQREK